MPIGKTTKCVDIPTEFLNYAEEDERVARMLLIESRYRHCVYFALQAMEKYLRARLFRLVDPYDREVINANRHHLIEVTIAELVKAIEEPVMKEQVRNQLNEHCPKDEQFHNLFNLVRYPEFIFSRNYYERLDVSFQDAEQMLRKLDFIKKFLVGIDMYIQQQNAKKKKTAPPRRS